MAIEVKLPELGENVATGDVTAILVRPGEHVEQDAPLLELETDKAVVEVPAPAAGVVTAIHVTAGTSISVGDPIVSLEPAPAGAADEAPAATPGPAREAAAPAAAAGPPPAHAAPAAAAARYADLPPTPATPAVRRLAREIGVDLATVQGSGPGGRILADDVKATAKRLLQARDRGAGGTAAGGGARLPLPDFARWGPIERLPMNAVRRATAAHLGAAWDAVPAVTQQDKADITELERLRTSYAARAEAAGAKLTITAILVRVVASALKVFPQFNASVDLERNEVVYKGYRHVGVAVDTERGLLVPVIRDVDRKNIVRIAADLSELSARARGRTLTAPEMQGGSFTISNLGGVGGSHFTPIVNVPEVAILGVSRAALEPVWQDDRFVPRLRLPLSLTYDHRLIDGVDGIRFLRWVIEALEQPLLLALEG